MSEEYFAEEFPADSELFNYADEMIKEEETDVDFAETLLRPRGKKQTNEPREFVKLDQNRFSTCAKCRSPLKSMFETRPMIGGRRNSDAYLLSCGHVYCEYCVQQSRTTLHGPTTRKNGGFCQSCNIPVRAHLLPNTDTMGPQMCETCHCVPAMYHCRSCNETRCFQCQRKHNTDRPKHNSDRALMTDNLDDSATKPGFRGCSLHHKRLFIRCSCGEMLCADCIRGPHQSTHGPLSHTTHTTTNVGATDEKIENFMMDTTAVEAALKNMSNRAKKAKLKFEQRVDDMLNEVACHFNLIVLQAIQRCWEVMENVKEVASVHHNKLSSQITDLNRVARMIEAGVELDESCRDPNLVPEEDAANILRSIAYGLCKNAETELQAQQNFHKAYNECEPQIILHFNTDQCIDSIREWGQHGSSNTKFLRTYQNFHNPSTARTECVNVNGGQLEGGFDLSGELHLTDVPLRLHTALNHFESLYQHRFADLNSTIAHPRRFTLGKKPLEDPDKQGGDGKLSSLAYDRSVYLRAGFLEVRPRILMGMQRCLNLKQIPTNVPENFLDQVAAATPPQAPLWVPDGSHGNAARAVGLALMRKQLQLPAAGVPYAGEVTDPVSQKPSQLVERSAAPLLATGGGSYQPRNPRIVSVVRGSTLKKRPMDAEPVPIAPRRRPETGAATATATVQAVGRGGDVIGAIGRGPRAAPMDPGQLQRQREQHRAIVMRSAQPRPVQKPVVKEIKEEVEDYPTTEIVPESEIKKEDPDQMNYTQDNVEPMEEERENLFEHQERVPEVKEEFAEFLEEEPGPSSSSWTDPSSFLEDEAAPEIVPSHMPIPINVAYPKRRIAAALRGVANREQRRCLVCEALTQDWIKIPPSGFAKDLMINQLEVSKEVRQRIASLVSPFSKSFVCTTHVNRYQMPNEEDSDDDDLTPQEKRMKELLAVPVVPKRTQVSVYRQRQIDMNNRRREELKQRIHDQRERERAQQEIPAPALAGDPPVWRHIVQKEMRRQGIQNAKKLFGSIGEHREEIPRRILTQAIEDLTKQLNSILANDNCANKVRPRETSMMIEDFKRQDIDIQMGNQDSRNECFFRPMPEDIEWIDRHNDITKRRFMEYFYKIRTSPGTDCFVCSVVRRVKHSETERHCSECLQGIGKKKILPVNPEFANAPTDEKKRTVVRRKTVIRKHQ